MTELHESLNENENGSRDRCAMREDAQRRLVTTRPEDMFNIITMQVAIAREHAARATRVSSAADRETSPPPFVTGSVFVCIFLKKQSNEIKCTWY